MNALQHIDLAAVDRIKLQLQPLLQAPDFTKPIPTLADAIAQIEALVPLDLSPLDLVTWATAAEKLAAQLPMELSLWVLALNSEAYNLRLRARALPLLSLRF